MPLKLLISLIFLILPFIFYAEETKQENEGIPTKVETKDEKEEKKLGIIAFPIVFYSSDTNFGFGASAVLHKEHYKDDYVSKSNSLAFVFFYTLRN